MQQIAQAWINELLLKAPFIAPLGIDIVYAAQDRVHIRLPFREQISSIGNHVHSGAVAALIEFAGTVAAVSGIATTIALRAALGGPRYRFDLHGVRNPSRFLALPLAVRCFTALSDFHVKVSFVSRRR
jgi:hypothetical protein